MLSHRLLAFMASVMCCHAVAWDVSPEQLRKIESPEKKQTTIEDMMPEPPEMVTAKPLDLMTPDEKLGKAVDAFHYLQSAKIECLWGDAWLGDTSKIMFAGYAFETIRHRLNNGKFPKRFSKSSLVFVAALGVAHVWNWLANSKRIWSVETWLGYYHSARGFSSGDQRADYYASSEQAYSEFLSLRNEREIRELMTKNPQLMILTLNYRELIRQASRECTAIKRMNENPLLDDSEEVTKIPTSPAQP